MQNAVTRVPAAASKVAIQHFESQFTFETDCWDVHDALESDNPGLSSPKWPATRARRYSSPIVPALIAMVLRAAHYGSQSSDLP